MTSRPPATSLSDSLVVVALVVIVGSSMLLAPEFGLAALTVTLGVFLMLLTLPELGIAFFVGGYWIIVALLEMAQLEVSALGVQVALLGTSCVAVLFRRRLSRPELDGFLLTSILLSIWMALTISWTPSPEYGTSKVWMFLLLNVAGLVILRIFVNSQRTFDRFAVAIVLLGIVRLALSAADFFGGIDHATQRLALLGDNPVFLARDLALTSLFAIYLITRGKSFLILSSVIGLNILLMVLSGSRMPLASFLLCGLLYFGLTQRADGKGMKSLVAAGLVVTSIAAVIVMTSGSAGTSRLLTSDPESESYRLRAYSVAVDHIADRPITGLGSGAFASFTPLGYAGDGRDYPHNLILEVTLEYGVVGLALLILSAWFVLRELKSFYGERKFGDNPALDLISIVLLFSTMNAMVSGDIYSNALPWMFGGLVLRFSRTSMKSRSPGLSTRPSRSGYSYQTQPAGENVL